MVSEGRRPPVLELALYPTLLLVVTKVILPSVNDDCATAEEQVVANAQSCQPRCGLTQKGSPFLLFQSGSGRSRGNGRRRLRHHFEQGTARENGESIS